MHNENTTDDSTSVSSFRTKIWPRSYCSHANNNKIVVYTYLLYCQYWCCLSVVAAAGRKSAQKSVTNAVLCSLSVVTRNERIIIIVISAPERNVNGWRLNKESTCCVWWWWLLSWRKFRTQESFRILNTSEICSNRRYFI